MKKNILYYDIYRIDNLLIKVGYLVLIISLIYFLISIFPKLNDVHDLALNIRSIVIVFLLIGSFFLLRYGYFFRHKEKIINSILRQLDATIEVSAIELMENTGYTKNQLEEAIQVINNHGLGFYVWNKNSGIISDGRLRRRFVFIESCPNCGNRIGKNYPISLDEIPTCPFCNTHLRIDKWNDLKYNELKNIEKNNEFNKIQTPKISILIVIFLTIIFWPSAVIYVMIKYKNKQFQYKKL